MTATYEIVRETINKTRGRVMLNDALASQRVAIQYAFDGNEEGAASYARLYQHDMRRLLRFVTLHTGMEADAVRPALVRLAIERL